MSIFEKLEKGVLCTTADETIALGRAVADEMPENQVLALSGDLGAGKTTFVKGVGQSLGIQDANITSPTFNIYAIHQGRFQLIHMDNYRLSGEEAMNDLLIEEFLIDPWLIAVEWPEKGLADWMQPLAWQLKFTRDLDEGTCIQLLDRPSMHSQ